MKVPVRMGTQAGQASSVVVNTENLINGYVESVPEGRAPTPVYGTPGLEAFATPTGTIRGMLETVEKLYVVADQLAEISSAGVVTNKGVIPAGTVDMAADGTNVVVTVAGRIFVWNGTATVEVTDADAPDASSVCWLNGYFIFTEKDEEQFFISPLNDPDGDYDALDFDSSDVRPDKLVRGMILGKTLLLFGRQSVEFWFYSGDRVFPFERYQDDPLDVGLIGVHAATTTNETVFWLANDKTARRLDGRTASNITTPAISKEIESWSDASLTVVTSHVWDGHLFVIFRNPDGCVVWDQGLQRWHKRQSYESDTWAPIYYARCFGKHLVANAKVYELTGYDDDGAVLPFEMVTPWIDRGGERFSINEVELRMEAGVGTPTDEPRVLLSRTEDGRTFTAEQQRGFGKAGNTLKQVKYTRQGQSRGCAFKVRITDPYKRVIYAMTADIS